MSALEKLLAALAAAAVLAVGYGVWQTHQQGIGEARAAARFASAIQAQKHEAAVQLAVETARAGAATRALQESKNNQEKKDAESQIAVAGLAARLRAAAPAGRLRDPNAAAAGCGGGGGSAPAADPARAGAGAADTAEAGGLLSPELTGLLFEQARAADALNLAYASCRADALSLREELR